MPLPSRHRAPPARDVGRRELLLGAGAAALGGCEPVSPLSRGRQQASLWFTYGGRNREVLEHLVQRFNHAQSAVYVKSVFQGDYYEGLAKLRVALAANAGPALSHVVGEIVPYLAEAGVLERLDAIGAVAHHVLPELGQRGSWVGGDTHPLVSLPFNRSTPIAYLNGAIFEQGGLSAPRSWDELRDMARLLTRRERGRTTRYGFGCPVDWWFWAALVGQAGGHVAEPNGDITLGGEAGLRAVDFWQKLVLEDGSMKPPAGRDYNAWEQTNQDFLAGRAAMIWTSTAFLSYLEKNARFPVVAAPLPMRERHAVPTGGTHWVLLKSAPPAEKVAALAFVRFMLEPAQVIDWANGTGYIPVTQQAVLALSESGHFTRHPNQRVALDQLKFAEPWPWSTRLFRVQREIVQPRLEQAVLGRGRTRELFAEARRLARAD